MKPIRQPRFCAATLAILGPFATTLAGSHGTLNVNAAALNMTGSGGALPAFVLIVGNNGTGAAIVSGAASVNISGKINGSMLGYGASSHETATFGGAASNSITRDFLNRGLLSVYTPKGDVP
jgi:hypothetical protein